MNQSGLLQSRSTERMILIAGFLLMLIPGAILVSNVQLTNLVFLSRDILTLSPIGEVVRPSRIVRRRSEDELAFSTSHSGDPVFVGDTIITGKESSTRIHLSDGSVLEVYPESMIKILPVRTFSFWGIKKKFNVTVQAGAVKARVGEEAAPIIFQSLTGTILKEIAPTVRQPKEPLTSPTITTALPVATTETPKPVTADFVVITAPPPAELPVSKESPIPGAVLPVQNPLSEAPSSLSKLPPLTPEISRKPETGRMISDFLSTLQPEPLEVKTEALPPATEEQPLLSKFVAPLQPVPDLEVTPLPATSLISEEADMRDQQFIFKWRDGGFRVKLPYSLKIEHGSETLSFETNNTEYRWNLPLEAKGKIRWWVEALLREGDKIQSKPQESSWTLPTPILASPGNKLELPEFYLKGESREVLLTWKQMKICKSFELNVSKTEDFKEVIFKVRTKKNFKTFPVQKPGKYFWRVGCNYTEEFKAFSQPFSFKLSRLN
jgi:hypothetical protein